MKTRDEIEQDILAQMKAIKERVKKDTQDTKDTVPQGSVPYDKETARAAIEQFLTAHPNKEDFVKKLKSKMDE